jgi:excisionase family DNA binding protein
MSNGGDAAGMEMPPAPPKRLLTLEEVAALCQVSPRTIRRRVRAGELEAARDPYDRLRFERANVEAWIKRRRAA